MIKPQDKENSGNFQTFIKAESIDLKELESRDRLIIVGNVQKEGFGHDQFVNIYDEVKLRQFLADKLNRINNIIGKVCVNVINAKHLNSKFDVCVVIEREIKEEIFKEFTK